jgi:hypothetical protein
MPIEPPEIPPASPGQPSEPPQENPPGNPRPEVPLPVREPGEPPTPDELPGGVPDEFPARGPSEPTRPNPATDARKTVSRERSWNFGVNPTSECAMNDGASGYCGHGNISNFAFERRHNPA